MLKIEQKKNVIVSKIIDHKGNVLENAWILDDISQYNADFLQTIVMSNTAEYLVLYKNNEAFDITKAWKWFLLE